MKEKNKKKMLLKLFLSTLYLSAFTFGGGICDRYTDEEKICRSISLDRRK